MNWMGKKTVLRFFPELQKKTKIRSSLSFLSFFRKISIMRAIFTLLDGYSGGRETRTASFLKKEREDAGRIRYVQCSAEPIPLSRRAEIAHVRVRRSRMSY